MAFRADHFKLVADRNAVRREAGLPLLDMREEMRALERQDAWARWNAACRTYAGERLAIRERIRAAYADDGRTLSSAGGRWLLETKTSDVFARFLRTKGFHRPDLSGDAIVYGGKSD